VLVNLGTPQAPTAAAVRPYLREFLSDQRVVELPRLLWWPILYGIILPLRPAKSARKYQLIWRPEGSPLRHYTARQAELVAAELGGMGIYVDYAMRYGNPSIASVLDRAKAAGVERVLVVPLYPQYSASSTGSALDGVMRWAAATRNVPELRLLRGFHTEAGYINAVVSSVREFWAQHGVPDRLLMSFHGIPRFAVERGDPYHSECLESARRIAAALDYPAAQIKVSFQSRFGRAEWLRPYTSETLTELGGAGRVDVVCPGFVADCLETLEEIALEGRDTFLAAGGREFNLIPCLNDRPDWIRALADLCRRNLQGWLPVQET
jgi:ferrochelatase